MTKIDVEDARAGVVITDALTGDGTLMFEVRYMEDDLKDLLVDLHGPRYMARDVLESPRATRSSRHAGRFLLSRRQGKS